MGGVLAIADSCSKWSKKTSVISVCGEDLDSQLSQIGKTYDFDYKNFCLKNYPTIMKHRYVDISSGNRVFEHYDFKPDEIPIETQQQILRTLEDNLANVSLVLLADYGHGFFGRNLIDALCNSDHFLAVNTQANAGNRGFNTFSKYARMDFLSLNGAELELELRRKDIDYKSVIPKIAEEKKCRNVIVTLGGGGLLTFDASGSFSHTPAFATKVIDKVGAGDSVLAVASMLSFLGAPKEVIGLLASIVAAFEVSQLGHVESLDIISMKKHVIGLLA
jgi:bifunctional ADP-heptose synthase (sugar kinase/adenylyltransferase)